MTDCGCRTTGPIDHSFGMALKVTVGLLGEPAIVTLT